METLLFTIEVTGWKAAIAVGVILFCFYITRRILRHVMRHKIIFEKEEAVKPFKAKNDYLFSLMFKNLFREDEIEKKIRELSKEKPLSYTDPVPLNTEEKERFLIFLKQLYFLAVKNKLGVLGNRDAAFETFLSFNHSILKEFDKFFNSDERYKIKSLVENKIKSLPVSDLKLFKFDHLVGINIEEMEVYRQNKLERNTRHELKKLTEKLNDLRFEGLKEESLPVASDIIHFLKTNEVDKEDFMKAADNFKDYLNSMINYYKVNYHTPNDQIKLRILLSQLEWLTEKIKQVKTLVAEKTE